VVLWPEGAYRLDSKENVVQSVCTPAASVADCHMLPHLLHGEKRKVWGDVGYQGQTKVIREAAPHAQRHDLPQNEIQGPGDELQSARTPPSRE